MSMWIEKNKSNENKTVYVMDYSDPLTNKRKYVSITLKGKATKRQYNDALIKLQDKVSKKLDRPLVSKNRTFESVALEWLESYQHEVKYSSWYNARNITKYICDVIDVNIKISKINSQFIQKFLDEEYFERKLSHSYVSSVKIMFNHIFKYAKKRGYILDVSFMKDVTLKKKPKTQEELKAIHNKFLNKQELNLILKEAYAKNKRYSMLCEFMCLTGVRLGEALAIRQQDIDLNTSTITISGSISSVSKKGGAERTTPKNNASYRTISINDRCIEIIKILLFENKKAKLLTQNYIDRGYIFTTKNGRTITHGQLNNFLHKIEKKIQLDKHLTSHIFRHTHISILTELGLPLKSIMHRVGHTNPNTTLKIYTHVTDEMTKELNKKLNDFKLEIS